VIITASQMLAMPLAQAVSVKPAPVVVNGPIHCC